MMKAVEGLPRRVPGLVNTINVDDLGKQEASVGKQQPGC